MAQPKKIRIGDLLVESNLISPDQLATALDEQKKKNLKLGRILIDLGFVTEDRLLDVLSSQMNIAVVDLKYYDFKLELVKLLPEVYARRFRAIVLDKTPDGFLVGMVDPSDLIAQDEISKSLNKPITHALVREIDLLKTLDIVYRRTEEIKGFATELGSDLSGNDFDVSSLGITDKDDLPVVKLLRSIFEDALQVNASDIHIEPEETLLRIRQRVDGILQEHIIDEVRIAAALSVRLKLMANLDIAEKRMPQDGRFNLKIKGQLIDIRLSTMPGKNGESIVMRLLNQMTSSYSLTNLGMPSEMLKEFRRQFNKPHGMVLITGPTGSGKTTTLYAVLNELNSLQKKIITIEDPVEYRLPRINQVQVNEKIELTFSRVLRSALRQDPDILMVGEIRDSETASIALRAAITGHLVLSTLHTNDALSSALRLIDMGVEGYLVASALRVIIAQRLVRRICESCKTNYTPTPQEKAWLERLVLAKDPPNTGSYIGTGCTHCNHTGYRGRIGIYEALIPTEEMISALRRNDPDAFSKSIANLKDFKPLVYSALDYARQGITTIHEVFRVTEID